jgi:hypothetical protein
MLLIILLWNFNPKHYHLTSHSSQHCSFENNRDKMEVMEFGFEKKKNAKGEKSLCQNI